MDDLAWVATERRRKERRVSNEQAAMCDRPTRSAEHPPPHIDNAINRILGDTRAAAWSEADRKLAPVIGHVGHAGRNRTTGDLVDLGSSRPIDRERPTARRPKSGLIEMHTRWRTRDRNAVLVQRGRTTPTRAAKPRPREQLVPGPTEQIVLAHMRSPSMADTGKPPSFELVRISVVPSAPAARITIPQSTLHDSPAGCTPWMRQP